MPPPFGNFTTKAKEAVRKAHELAIERGQNHVSSVHLTAALLMQEDSVVVAILERLEIDTILFTDSVIELMEAPPSSSVLSPSYQLYLTPDLAQALEAAVAQLPKAARKNCVGVLPEAGIVLPWIEN